MPSGICSNASSECSTWYYGKGFTTDEYVCCWYTVKSIGRNMCFIFYNGYVAGDGRFYFYRNEKNDGYVCGKYDVKAIVKDDKVILPLNLQFFAKEGEGGEKTEEPTSKKLSDARSEGQVAKSKEIANGFGLLSFFLVLKFMAGYMGTSLIESFAYFFAEIPETAELIAGPVPEAAMMNLLINAVKVILTLLAPLLIIGFVVAFVSDYVQVKWKPTTKPLKPKFSKINPISGFKKFFSLNSIVELVKAVAKIGLIIYVVYSYLKDKIDQLFLLYDIQLLQAIIMIGELVIDLGIRISIIYMVIAAADYVYQKWKFHEDMKMTKQEVKEEYKNQEGNPEIKGKIRSKMREASQRRMMQSLPEADVVITNPTHYAVAIKYDPDTSPAPIVIAKGEDYLAQKIKEVAREHHVEIVENKPLARMLYANVEIGAEIPPELYQAVAEVLAFVYHIKGKI